MVATALIVIVGVFFLGMGCLALVAPAAIGRQFGIDVAGNDSGRAEFRAVYGGFGVAMAAVLTVALVDDALRGGIVLTAGTALAGMAAGRVVSALLGDRTRLYPNWFYFGVESLAATALLIAC